MQRRTIKRLQGLIGLLLILLAVGGIFAWEVYGRDTFLSDEIIVLKNDVNVHEVITADLLMKIKRPRESLSIRETFNLKQSQIIYDYDQVIGLAAKHYIPEGQTLVKEYFTQNKLIPLKEQYTFPVPKEWIMAMPGSLRRGDTITLYPLLKDKEKLLETLAVSRAPGSEEGNKEPRIELSEVESEELIMEDSMPIMTSPEILGKLIKDFAKGVKAFSFTTLHVKDGSNKEVISIDIEEPEDKRYNGSSNIRDIEILATDQEVEEMKDLVDKGYVFILMYKR